MFGIKRREFISLLGGAAVTWPVAARAQQVERMRRIGVLMTLPENSQEGQAWVAAFKDGLQKVDWSESIFRSTPVGEPPMQRRSDLPRKSSRLSPT
jgi:hypothetical protein